MVFFPFRKQLLCWLSAAVVVLLAGGRPAAGITIVSCSSNPTICPIPANVSVFLPFSTYSGDVVLINSKTGLADEVFRIYNNVINTGEGTGFGNAAFLYSAGGSGLPAPSSYSANAVFIAESPGITSYASNGTTFLLGVPEPETGGVAGLVVGALAYLQRRRARA